MSNPYESFLSRWNGVDPLDGPASPARDLALARLFEDEMQDGGPAQFLWKRFPHWEAILNGAERAYRAMGAEKQSPARRSKSGSPAPRSAWLCRSRSSSTRTNPTTPPSASPTSRPTARRCSRKFGNRWTSASLSARLHPVFHAPVAQLDRASASGAEGCGFEPRQAHHSRNPRRHARKPMFTGVSSIFARFVAWA